MFVGFAGGPNQGEKILKDIFISVYLCVLVKSAAQICQLLMKGIPLAIFIISFELLKGLCPLFSMDRVGADAQEKSAVLEKVRKYLRFRYSPMSYFRNCQQQIVKLVFR